MPEGDFELYTQSALKWYQTLRRNIQLVHLDMSFNSFKKADMQFIGEAMSKNHKILGLHLMGNEASVDELGFISPEQVWNAGTAHVFTRIPCKHSLSSILP